jgi:hypothetical protein
MGEIPLYFYIRKRNEIQSLPKTTYPNPTKTKSKPTLRKPNPNPKKTNPTLTEKPNPNNPIQEVPEPMKTTTTGFRTQHTN